MATVLVDVLHRLDALWGQPMPYMLWLHQRPFDETRPWREAHLHAEIAVPLRAPGVQRYVAAGELGSGLFVNPVIPEAAAGELREVGW
jgi:UDPglucose--hexose-1-phosphate uridylyltransferase